MKRLLAVIFLLGIFGGVVSAQALPQFTITYSALPATPAPTTAVLVAIGLLFTFLVSRKMRQLAAGRPLLTILFACGLGLVAVHQARAIAVTDESMTGPGPLVFSVSGGEVQVTNNTGATEVITGITLTNGTQSTPLQTPQCQVGTTLTVGASCYLFVGLPV